jgi:DNA-binding transcriptional LysR family regulator
MDLDPRRLGVLAAVARTGGVLAAAEALHVTPSAVSQQVARLEREAGVALVVRGGRRISLTAAGVALAERGERIVAELAAARADLALLTDRASGTVTVVTFPTAVAALVAPTAIQLRQAHPGITLRVEENAEELLDALLAGSIDLLVIERDAAQPEAPPRGLRDVPLLDDPYLVAVPTAWSLPARLADLATVPWVASTPGSAADRVLQRAAQADGWQPQIAHRALEFPATLALVAAGLGCALLPRLALPDPGSRLARDIRAVPLPGLGARRLLARHRTARYEPSPAVAAVLAGLAETATASHGP